MIRAAAAALLAGFLVAGCGGADTSPAGGATQQPGPTASGPAIPLDPGQRFVKEFLSYPGLSTTMSETELINLARSTCEVIGTPGVTRDTLVAALSTTKLGPQVAPVLVDVANRTYCPEKTFSSAPAAPYTPQGQAPQAASSGPLTTFGSGTYEVGVDIEPGKYKTPGPASGSSCYWARLKDTAGEFESIIANGNTEGPTTVTVAKTDGAFETRGCTWTKAG